MSFEPGALIGPYTIVREIGRGGMGVVYLARDPRLDRMVAVKALPEHLAQDTARLERFQSEARALAQLNHPSVGGIHGLEEKDGQRFLILEYVEGETLTARLEREQPTVDEALEIAVQIASGVEAAHDAGVIHRDLKPDNILLTPGGAVKILDFGLAKLNDGATSSIDPSGSSLAPTMTSEGRNSPTLPGVILGTAAYMSPEQARGRRVDKRTDIWSFGVLLYELLTGTSPFVGETASDTLGAVLHKDVDLTLLPEHTPTVVRRVLSRCLERDRNRRFRDIGDVRLELESRGGVEEAVGSAAHSRRRLPILGAVALVAVAGWAFSALRTAPVPPPASVHLAIPMEPGKEVGGAVAISRDGRTIAFAARDDEDQFIYLRHLDDFDLQVVPNSRDGTNPVFSPDGKSIIYHAQDAIYRAGVSGGAPTRLVTAKWMAGASWGEDGRIVYSEGVNSPLLSIPEGGGEPVPFTRLADDSLSYAHVWPQRIPGTDKMLLTSWVGGPNGGARLLDLSTGKFTRFGETRDDRGSFIPPARWSASGHLIFEKWSAGLFVLPFDPDADTPIIPADARPLLEDVYDLGNATRSVFALADDGTLVYAPGNPNGKRLVWVEADGSVEVILDQRDLEDTGLGGVVELSADGTRVLTGNAGDIAEVDLRRNIPRRLTFEGGNDRYPLWNADESAVIFASNRDIRWSIWTVGLAASSEPELRLRRDENIWPSAVSADGAILFVESHTGYGSDLMIQDPDGEVRMLAATRSNEFGGTFSPAGFWTAYISDVSGREEVYVIRTDGTGAPLQVSNGGGQAPKFHADGRSLYYRRHRSVLRVAFADGQPQGEPEIVFAAPNLATGSTYDITADGTRMIAIQLDDDAIPRELRVITDFFAVIREAAAPATKP